MTELIGIGVAILCIFGIFKVFQILTNGLHGPDEWDDEDREKSGWWGN